MHLVVVQHGLWGAPANTSYLCELLREELGERHYVLNGDVNSGHLTYDGIDVCGDRLHTLVINTIDTLAGKGTPVKAISLIGYSMGGLITRYVAGKLYAEGLFSTMAPVNFITVATPHLGSWRMPSTWYNRAFNFMVPVVTSRSGYQLVLQDKHAWDKPLLCLMSHPDLLFMRALRCFRRLALYANVFHDRPVPYCTAAIRLDNPYEHSTPVAIDPKYPSIVAPAASVPAVACRPAKGSGGDPAATVTASAASAAEEGMASPLYAGPATTVVGGVDGSGGGGGNVATSQPPPQRPLRSTYLRFLMVAFLPLAVPALIFMVLTGRKHHCKMQRTALDFSWITHYHHRHQHGRQASRAQGQASGAAEGAAGESPVADGIGDADQDNDLPSDIECPSAPNVSVGPVASGDAATAVPAGGASGGRAAPATAAAAASLAAAAAGSLDADGADGVVVSEQSVLLHDGIVELPEELHRVQEWIVEQLNQLPWQKVDVDCRDFHAHAAIIMRNPRRFVHNRDVMDHLVHNFARA